MPRQYPSYQQSGPPTPGWVKLLLIAFVVAIVIGSILQILKDIYPEWFK